MSIKEFEPKGIWKNFYELTRIPRPSGHLEKIQQFLLDWAQQRGIEAFKDNAGNIIMRQPATKGYENLQTVTMEAHMDMVPQKALDSSHNFQTDPIETYIDGEWVKAKGTTLGSDDGIGVATAMAVLEDDKVEHGPVEAIFTVDEETCMYGVNNLKPETLKGRILLNLDNETEGEIIVGSAGGEDVEGSLEYQSEKIDDTMKTLQISLKGLKGGHSGLEINLGRANATKLTARLLCDLIEQIDMQLVNWKGGNMRNAIPNNASFTIAIHPEDEEPLKEIIEDWEQVFKAEYEGIEDSIKLTVEEVEKPENAVPEEIRDNIINTVLALPAGVSRMIPSVPDIVETSCNLGILTLEDGQFMADLLVRSSCDSQLIALEETITSVFSLGGMAVRYLGHYGSWQPDFKSPILKTVETVYKNKIGKEAHVQVVHAGLECSIIKMVYPDMDMVSFGPTLRSPHTPFERCNIPSVGIYWEFVKELLKNIPSVK